MLDAAGREVIAETLIEVTPTLTPLTLATPDDIATKAYQLLGEIKSSGCAGIVIILGGSIEVQIIAHGLDNSNAAETLREVARAVEVGGMVTEVAFDLRPSVSN